jgi:hypothetical protein
VLRKFYVTMMVAVALLACSLPAQAGHVLGIIGKPFPSVGGVQVTTVTPDSNATLLGLEVGDVIVALGNPGVADMAVPANDTDIENMMLACGDNLIMVVLKKKTFHFDIAQSPLTADKVVSLPFGDEDSTEATFPVAASKSKQKVSGPSVKSVLKNQDDPGRKNVKVGKVTHLTVHKSAFDNVNSKDKGKDTGKDKGKGKGKDKKPAKSGSSGKKLEVLDLLEDIGF